MSQSTENFSGCGLVSNLVRGLGDWLRGSCWSNSPSQTSASSRSSQHNKTCSSQVVVNRGTTSKHQRSLDTLSEESASRCPSSQRPLIANVGSASHESGLKAAPPYKQPHATTCMETAASLAPLVFSISSQKPLTIAFTSTDTSSRVLPVGAGASATLPSSGPASRSDSVLSSHAPQQQLEGAAEFSDFEMECLLIHNDYRERHGVPPLSLNKQMCEAARGLATGLCCNSQLPVLTSRDIDDIHKMCRFAENMATALCGNTRLPPVTDRKYGEVVLVSRSMDAITPQQVCDRWYDQRHNFEFGVEPKASKSRRSKCNFTQMIWRGTRELGIAIAHVDGTSAVVGLYYPAGNVAGQYVHNCPRLQDFRRISNSHHS